MPQGCATRHGDAVGNSTALRVTVVTTCRGDHVVRFIQAEPLGCTPETSTPSSADCNFKGEHVNDGADMQPPSPSHPRPSVPWGRPDGSRGACGVRTQGSSLHPLPVAGRQAGSPLTPAVVSHTICFYYKHKGKQHNPPQKYRGSHLIQQHSAHNPYHRTNDTDSPSHTQTKISGLEASEQSASPRPLPPSAEERCWAPCRQAARSPGARAQPRAGDRPRSWLCSSCLPAALAVERRGGCP